MTHEKQLSLAECPASERLARFYSRFIRGMRDQHAPDPDRMSLHSLHLALWEDEDCVSKLQNFTWALVSRNISAREFESLLESLYANHEEYLDRLGEVPQLDLGSEGVL